jgi:hypothetical protein
MDLHPNPSLNIPNQIDMGENCYLCWLVASQQCRVFRWFYFKPQKEGFTYSFTVMTSKYSSWIKSVSIEPITSLNDKNDATLLPTGAAFKKSMRQGQTKGSILQMPM